MVRKRNISIQLIRVVAMSMIIFDHLLAVIEFPMKSAIIPILNSGVFIFLLISGYLYGNKNIENWKNWFLNRIMRICIPMWIFMIIDFVVEALIWNQFDIKLVIIYAFNLQGILGVNVSSANLWFLTLIMICYIITPILQFIKQKKLGANVGVTVLITAIIVQIILAYTINIGMVAGHTMSWCMIAIGMYIVGYFLGNTLLSDNIGRMKIIVWTAMAAISLSVILIFQFKFDGHILYDRIVIFYGMAVVDLWISTVIYKLGQYVKGGVISKIIDHLDTVSYEVYIVHVLVILAGTVNILTYKGVIEYIISTIVLSYVAALVLHVICDGIYSMISLKCKKRYKRKQFHE